MAFTFTKAVDSVEFPAELYLGQYSLSLLHFVFGFPVRTNDTRYFCIMTCGTSQWGYYGEKDYCGKRNKIEREYGMLE